jgi:hypothetical protein
LNFCQMGDVIHFHAMEAALDLGVSSPVTIQNRNTFPSIS